MTRRWMIPAEWEPIDGATDWYPSMEQASLGANIVLGEN